jgi:hypothetical protein
MADTEANMDKTLNKKQLELLLLLYKFRFVTVEMSTKVLHLKSENSVRDRLQKLVREEYIGRRYDSSYRIKSRHAEYFLLTKGIATLKQQSNCNNTVLHSMYKDKTASDTFVQQRLAIMETYCHIQSPQVKFLTQSQLAGFNGFPKPLPDGFVSIKTNKLGKAELDATKQTSKYFFLEVVREAEPFFVALHRRAKRYIAYSESGDWQIAHKNTPFPTILIVCETPALQKRLGKRIAKLTEASWSEELTFYTTTLAALGDGGVEGKVWVDFESETVGLISL